MTHVMDRFLAVLLGVLFLGLSGVILGLSCQEPNFFYLVRSSFLGLSCQKFWFCFARSPVFYCLVRSSVFYLVRSFVFTLFFPVLSVAMRCPGACTGLQRQNSPLRPENADKSGKKVEKWNLFGHRELKLFCETRKSAIFGSHRAKILL